MNRSGFFRMILAGATAMVLAAGCRTQQIDPYTVLQVPTTQRLYTAYNLWVEGETLSSLNYQTGRLIPFGTEVRVDSVTPDRVVFRVPGAPKPYTLRYQEKYALLPITMFLPKLFTTDDAAVQSRGIPPDTLRQMRAGQVSPGMTKEQVIKVFGYPSPHRTPSLDADSWIYWRTRTSTVRIFFKNNRVIDRQ